MFNLKTTTTAVMKFKKPIVTNKKKNEYVNSATLHGFTRVWNTQRWERRFWISILCVSICVLSYGVFALVQKYYSYKVLLDSKQVIDQDLELPAITICNNKRLGMQYQTGTLHPDNVKTAFSTEFYNYTKTHPTFCWVNAYRTCTLEKDFVVTGENASCITWNNDGKIKQLLPGNLYGLRFTLYVNVLEQSSGGTRLKAMGPLNSLTVVTHFANERPAVTFDGFEITAGVKTRVELQKRMFIRLPAPYQSNCRQATQFDELPRKPRYSRTSCFEFCFLRYGVETCGDVIQPQYAVFVPESVMRNRKKNVTADEVGKCYRGLMMKFIPNMKKLCHCPTPCNEVIYYKNFYSIPMQDSEIENHKQVTLKDSALSFDEVRRSIYEIDFFYPRLGYNLIQERPAYSIPEALADFGGQLGLAVGASSLSIIEIVVIIYLHFFPKKLEA